MPTFCKVAAVPLHICNRKGFSKLPNRVSPRRQIVLMGDPPGYPNSAMVYRGHGEVVGDDVAGGHLFHMDGCGAWHGL